MISSEKMLLAATLIRETETALADILNRKAVLHIEMDGEDKKPTGVFVAGLLEQIKEQARVKFLFEKKLTAEIIIQSVCDIRGVEIELLTSKSRKQEYVFARNLCYHFLFHLLSESLTNIGKRLGGRDHSTVIHGLEKLQEDLASDYNLKQDFEMLTQKFNTIIDENITEAN